jgi:hypothetical protein
MEPQIHFSNTEPSHWTKKSLKELNKEMDALRIEIKNATKYTWDNTHFYIDSIFGRPALQVGFYEKDISFWNAETGTSMGSFDKFTDEEYAKVRDWIHHIEDREVMCCECEKWVPDKTQGHHYSFAGFVCNKCYDPKVHLPPDTRGD